VKIKNQSAGKLHKTARGYHAFIPNSLPPVIVWDGDIIKALSKADFLLGKLARETTRLPCAHLLVQSFMAKEAVLSSRIEGTQTTLGEVFIDEAQVNTKYKNKDLIEVQNYVKALHYAIERLEFLPLSLRLIKELHAILMDLPHAVHATPGEFRKSQNWIGSPGCTLKTAKYVPPPVEDLMNCLGDLEKFFYDDSLPDLVHIALCHYQFEAIHPFVDGNGRIGRLLITLLLMHKNLLPAPMLYLSAFFESSRDQYYEGLFNVSYQSDWKSWLLYFLKAVAVQCQDVLHRSEQIQHLIEKWKEQCYSARSNTAEKIIDMLAASPVISISMVAEKLNSTYSTAERAVKKLVGLKIVKQRGEDRRNRIYCATSILAVLEAMIAIDS